MLLLVGINDDNIITEIKEHLGMDVLVLGKSAEVQSVGMIVQSPEKFSGNGVWCERKFVIMHNLENEDIKRVLSLFKSEGMRDVIFATTTETSLGWKLRDLLSELIKEDEYFRGKKSTGK